MIASFVEPCRAWVVLPGVRLSKKQWFAEFATLMPLFEEARDLYRYMPLGIPMLSIGRH